MLIVDDVITAGTAIRESLEIIRAAGAAAGGAWRWLSTARNAARATLSAVQEVEQQHGLTCVSIVTLADLIETCRSRADGPARISASSSHRCAPIGNVTE